MVRQTRYCCLTLLGLAAAFCLTATFAQQPASPYPTTAASADTSRYPQTGPYPSTAPPRYPSTAAPAAANPAAAPTYGPTSAVGPTPATLRPNNRVPLEGGQLVARIGSEIVLASEILVGVQQILDENAGRAPQSELDKAKRMLMQRNLQQLIETKLVYSDARRTIPADNFPTIEEKLLKDFEARQLPRLYEMTEATTRSELESRLVAMGTTLDQQKRTFSERTLAQQWLRQQIDYDVQVSHEEMVDYYRAHPDEFAFEATARWEELMVRFDQFADRASAYRALAEMGNAVWKGEPLADVAQASSQGVTAEQGGAYDWTTRGSLVLDEINRAIFTLPVGQLSQIIETTKGFHVVRVTERRDAGRTPFIEAQVEIKEKIKKKNVQAQIETYVEKLKRETKVWTIYDDEPVAEQAGRPAPAADPTPSDDRYGQF